MARIADRDSRDRRPTIVGRLCSFVLFVTTLMSAAALILSLIAPYFASTHGWLFPFIGLVSPAIYIFNLVLALYFIIRWKLLFALPLLVLLLLGVNRVSLYVKIPFTKDYGLENYKGCVKVMSYNTRGLMDDSYHSSVDAIAKYINESKPDVICLQEYHDKSKGKKGNLAKQLSRYNRAYYGTNAIYSRYKILKRGDIFEQADTLGGRSMYVDLLIGDDTIRVINNHLNSNQIEDKDKAYLKASNLIRDTMRKERLGSIVRKFAHGAAERTTQVQVIRESMDTSPYRYIVCGDMNDVPISFAYYELSRGMTDAFVACGDGYSYTFRGFGNLLRIDYILTSSGITPMSYYADREFTASDHIPITAHIKIDKKPKK